MFRGFAPPDGGELATSCAVSPRLDSRWKTALEALVQSEDGTALLETALVAPALIALVIAILMDSLTFFAQQGLETAAEGAARSLMTGKAQQTYTGNTVVNGVTTTPQQQFGNSVCSSLPFFLSCDRLYIDVSTATSLSNASTTAQTLTYNSNGNVSNNFAYSPGGPGSIIVVKLMYLWPTVGSTLGFNLSNQRSGNQLLVATSVLKTEDY
jgi:Flp pilus assembly protein TadG